MKTYTFYTSALNGNEWLTASAGRFIPPTGERALGTHCIGSWVGPRAGLEALEKKKNAISAPAGNRTLVVQYVACSLYNNAYGFHF
jgi:hypothetical protein